MDLFTYACNTPSYQRKDKPEAWTTTDKVNGEMFMSYPVFSFIPGTQGDKEPTRFGDFVLDIDTNDLACSDALKIIDWFDTVYGVEPEQWRIYLSGKKGIHLELPDAIMGTERGHVWLPLGYKRLAKDIEGELNVKIDCSMYNKGSGKPYRQPNVMRPCGTCKRQIDHDTLFIITSHDEYITYCDEPGPEWVVEDTRKNNTLASKVAAYLQDATDSQQELANSPPISADDRDRLSLHIPPCISHIANLTDNGLTSNTFNDVAIQLTAYAVSAGMTERELLDGAGAFISHYPSSSLTTIEKRTRNVIDRYRTMAANGYQHSCGGVLALRFFGFDCATCKVNDGFDGDIVDPDNQENLFVIEKEDDIIIAPLPGVLGDVVDYFNANSLEKQPLFSIQVALALGSIICSRNYRTDYDNYSSLFFMFIAESGTGKDSIKSVIRNILKASGLGYLIGSSWFTADTTLVKSMAERPRQILLSDEMGRRLHTAAKADGKDRNIITKLMEMFSSAHDTVDCLQYVDMTSHEVDRPGLTVCGITTQSTLMDSITTEMVDDGFLNRWLYCVSLAKKTSKLRKKKGAVPESIKQWCADYGAEPGMDGGINLDIDKGTTADVEPITVPFNDDCEPLLIAFEEENIKLSASLAKCNLGPMCNRMREIAMRVALVVAMSCESPEITADHTKWAIDYVRATSLRAFDMMKRHLAGSAFEKNKMEFLHKIRQAGAKGENIKQVGRKKPFSILTARERSEVFNDLIETGLIEVRKLRIKGNDKRYLKKFYEAYIALK